VRVGRVDESIEPLRAPPRGGLLTSFIGVMGMCPREGGVMVAAVTLCKGYHCSSWQVGLMFFMLVVYSGSTSYWYTEY